MGIFSRTARSTLIVNVLRAQEASNMDYTKFLLGEYLVTFGWALVGAFSMAVSLGITLRIFDLFTPNLDEIDELKKGNVAVGIVIAALFVSVAIVVAICMGLRPEAVSAIPEL